MNQAAIFEQYRSVLESAFEASLSYLRQLDASPVAAPRSAAELRRQLGHALNEQPMDARQVVDELIRDTEGGLTRSGGPRFFGWVIGGSVPASLAADWLTGTWDQNACLYAASPAMAIVEEITGEWLKDLFGLPKTASYSFVTGCQQAHVTCLAAARHAVLAAKGWDVEVQGLSGAPAIRILCSDQRHGSAVRAVRLLGLGTGNIEALPSDASGLLQADVLRAGLEKWKGHPVIVMLQAGELSTGIYDPFSDLLPVAKEYGAWVHVDGAFGLWAAASPEYRHLLRGVEGADSWATDGHKWLNVPYDSGYAFVAHPEAHAAAISYRTSYLASTAEARDQMDWTPEWSRRGRALATYAAIRELGREGIAALVERNCALARLLVEELGALEGVEVLWTPVINQGMVRFLDPRPGSDDVAHDAFTDRVIAAILTGGDAFFGGVTWKGRRAMRISVSNWLTDEAQIRFVVGSIARILEAQRVPVQA